MKKLVTLIIVCTFLGVSAQKLSFGVKAGLSYNAGEGTLKVVGNAIDDVIKSKGSGAVGYQGGVFVRAGLAGLFIQPELLYTTYKTEYDEARSGFYVKKNRLDLPITLGKKFIKIIHLQAGPVFSYYFEDDISLSDIQSAENNDFNVGFQLGGGVDISNFVIDIRYEFGFGENASEFIYNKWQYQTENRPSLLHLSIGYLF